MGSTPTQPISVFSTLHLRGTAPKAAKRPIEVRIKIAKRCHPGIHGRDRSRNEPAKPSQNAEEVLPLAQDLGHVGIDPMAKLKPLDEWA
jgi:hypothetical protein